MSVQQKPEASKPTNDSPQSTLASKDTWAEEYTVCLPVSHHRHHGEIPPPRLFIFLFSLKFYWDGVANAEGRHTGTGNEWDGDA